MPPKPKPQEHRLYPVIRKMVLSGDSAERINTKLRANDLTGSAGESLLGAAHAERIGIIRKKHSPHIVGGFAFALFAYLIFRTLSTLLGVLDSQILVIIALVGLAGLGLLASGIIGWCYAPRQTGPVDDDLAEDF